MAALTKEEMSKYLEAGRIAAHVREQTARMIKPGASALEIVEAAEQEIIRMGCGLACPVTLSLNDAAAHSTPGPADKTVIGEKDVAKLDIGVQLDGCIADTAVTVCLDKGKERLKRSAEKALEAAIKTVRPGVTAREVGREIQQAIEKEGYRPIANLTGHVLGRYNLHAGFNIPNIDNGSTAVLEEGMAVAIEPFATDGAGSVKESGAAEIYRFESDRPVRLPAARKVLELSKTSFNKMPFAARWVKGVSPVMLSAALRQLTSVRALRSYPVLREVAAGCVAQAEDTVIVTADGYIVTTRPGAGKKRAF